MGQTLHMRHANLLKCISRLLYLSYLRKRDPSFEFDAAPPCSL